MARRRLNGASSASACGGARLQIEGPQPIGWGFLCLLADVRRARTLYVAHPARPSTPPRALEAHATTGITTVPRKSRILRDHPHRPVRSKRTLLFDAVYDVGTLAFG
ncbi:hypothetical protein [Idiomarina sp.]|uniref:hypothetical protein n=1 Tax=Idiomarina sp. TaxID=1874361 RepID=UPI0035119538